MRTALPLCALLFASPALSYVHVPPQTLAKLCADSRQIRALKVKSRQVEKGAVVFEVADALRDKEKSSIASFRLLVRPDAAQAKAALDRLAPGSTAVLFSQEDGDGKRARGFGYVFLDEFVFSVDYNAQAELWLYLRPEPNLSLAYSGPARELPALTKAILAGKKNVKVPTKAPAKEDDLSLRGLLIEEARRKNGPTYPKVPLPTAWGKPVKGLQAGLRINPAVEVAGAALSLEVVVRNVDPKPRTFSHLQLAFGGRGGDGCATGRAEEVVSQFTPKGTRWTAYVSPGDSYPLAVVPLFREGQGKAPSPRLRLEPGVSRVGMEGVAVRLGSGGKGDDVELATGYLDVTLPPGP